MIQLDKFVSVVISCFLTVCYPLKGYFEGEVDNANNIMTEDDVPSTQ